MDCGTTSGFHAVPHHNLNRKYIIRERKNITTKKLRIPILLLALWLIAATVIPQSYAAGGTHRGEVKNGTGYTSSAVGVNV